MDGLFAAIGKVERSSIKKNGRGYGAMLRVSDNRFYLSGLTVPPGVGDLFVLGRLYSFRASSCGQQHTGVQPLVVLPVVDLSPDLINSFVCQWISAAIDQAM